MKIGKPQIGLALGAGGAKGWAHLGVFRALEEAQIPVKLVTGSSIGALMGAFYCAGSHHKLHHFAKDHHSIRQTLALLDFRLKNGFVGGKRLMKFLEKNLPVENFEELAIPLGVVATSLSSMEEVHFTAGKLLPAIRASVSIPGFLAPFVSEGEVFVDGAMLNPVPINLARKMGADVVIAVDLRGRRNERRLDTFGGILYRSADTMINRIRQMNTRLFPADILIETQLTGYGMMDYHKTREAIQAGYAETKKKIPEIKKLLSRRFFFGSLENMNSKDVAILSREHRFSSAPPIAKEE